MSTIAAPDAQAAPPDYPPCAVCRRPVEIDKPRKPGVWYAHIECAGHLDLTPIKAPTIKDALQQLRARGPGVGFHVLLRDKGGPVTLYVRPEPAAPDPPLDEVTFALDPDGKIPLAKRVLMGLVLDPPFLTQYRYAAEPVSNLRDLLGALTKGAAGGAFALRGKPKTAVGRRALADDPEKGPGGLDAVPRHHASLDWDSIEAPPGVDPLDGAACARAIVPLLPPEMRRADLIWQLTAGAGVKPGIRIRTHHWLDRPLSTAELKHWLAPLHKGEDAVLDPCTLENVQPIFLGVLGGPQVERWGILPGEDGDTVAVPPLNLPAPRQPRPRAPGGQSRQGHPRMRKLIRDCLDHIRAARGKEGHRLPAFKHWGARALALAEIAGMNREHVEDLLMRAGEDLYADDPERYCRNIEPLIEWWRARNG